jgi:biotin synthase
MRFETSDAALYKKMRGSCLEDRLNLIKALTKLGYVVATGALIGLPGQSKESIARDILLTTSLKPEMYSFGPFVPHPKTPLAKARALSSNDFLRVLSAIRLCDKKARILVTTAFETLDKDGRKKGLLAGGNSIMLNATPERYKELYEIYPNKPKQELRQQISEAIALLHSLGRAPTDLGA